VTVKAGDGSVLHLADASKMKVNANNSTQSGLGLELENGCLFTDVNGAGTPVALGGAGNAWTVDDAVVVSDVRSGTLTILVLSGNVKLSDGTEVKEGESYTVLAKSENGGSASESAQGESAASQSSAANASGGPMKLSIAALDSFALEHALDTAKAGRALVFTEEQINEELERRENERLQLAKQAAEANVQPSASESAGATAERSETHEAAGTTETTETTVEQTVVETSESSSDTVEQGKSSHEPEAETPSSKPEAPAAPERKDERTCTIQIRCDTILNNMNNLAEGKSKYVPKNGVLLRSTSTTFEEGETAFDVLNRACKENGIALEYSYVPIYSSYYVEGIGNLYEFDCGDESGWMYKVNGWFPNYGCAQYELSDGDAIVFCYTCKGLGEDVGA